MSDTINNSLISRGVFGRLSYLSIDREVLVEDLLSARKSHYPEKEWVEQEEAWIKKHKEGQPERFLSFRVRKTYPVPKTKEHELVIRNYLPNLLMGFVDELSNLTEAIVLSDNINILAGFKRTNRSTTPSARDFLRSDCNNLSYKNSIESHPGLMSLRSYEDETNSIISSLLDNMKVNVSDSIGRAAFDSTFIAKHIYHNETLFDVSELENSEAVNVDKIECFSSSYIKGNGYGFPLDLGVEGSKAYMGWYKAYAMEHRGEGFLNFRKNLQEKLDSIPVEFFNVTYKEPMILNEWCKLSKLMFELYLYEEIVYSIEKNNTVIPGWGGSEYYEYLFNQLSLKTYDVRELSTAKYKGAIEEELTKSGLSSFNMAIPQIFSACSVEANSVEDIIVNAINIRKTRWAKELRKYIREVISSDTPAKVISSVSKLDRYMDLAVKGKSPTGLGNITFTTHGSASVAVGDFFANIKARNHPAIVFNNKIYKKFYGKDVVNNLARIFNLKSSDVLEFYRRNT